MAGDLGITERAVFEQTTLSAAALMNRQVPGPTLHRYGRVSILAVPAGATGAPVPGATALPTAAANLSEVERLGIAALQLRESQAYRAAKQNRPRDGQQWDLQNCTTVAPPPAAIMRTVGAQSAGPTSAYLEGTVAVGIIVVQGPTPALQFTDDELLKVVAEVQNGLGWYATTNPIVGISFSYDIQDVILTLPADAGVPDLEAYWRNPAMQALGFSADWNGVGAYVESIRERFGTRWAYCAFFTKYPLVHFAYASIGGPRLVMDYNNDGWGPDNIDRVFAHETGHIFGCPDEYASSGCTCGGSWGRYGLANGNCETCASGGGVPCLMKANTFSLCGYTPSHLGWSPQLVVPNFGYSAGGWRVDKHPRLLANVTGDGRADIIGFGDAGVWLSRSQPSGRYATSQFVVANFGFDAGGWRVDKHPRFLADITGDGRDDIVGFGDAGVWISLNNGDAAFQEPQFVVANFGFDAGGWRVDKHPRFLVDITGDGRADIVGFGDAGVWVSRNNGDGTFQEPQFVLANFGFSAGGWRVDKHPRFMADVTGDGRADVVGFGNAGVWVSRNNGDGSFQAPQLVVANFGFTAGGWRIEKHPRLLADTTGDGSLDIVGFGDAGVWVSRNNGDGTFQAPQLVVASFGYSAGGWRIESHPRFLADTTGDGRLDIVGFGNEGVWISRSLADNTFEAPGRVIANFGFNAGGWRVDKHPRFLADTTGDGRADIVGFGDAGVWVSRS